MPKMCTKKKGPQKGFSNQVILESYVQDFREGSLFSSELGETITFKTRHQCPICRTPIILNINKAEWEACNEFPFLHIVVHGKCLHGVPPHYLLVYLDKAGKVRAIERGKSIEYC